MKNVLVLPGGGIRGYVSINTALFLEQKLKRPLVDHFDLIAGTSTGSIIACAMGHGIPVWQIRKLYEDRSGEIFKNQRSLPRRMTGAKYDIANLIKVLSDYFDTQTMEALKPKIMVFAAATDPVATKVYKSWKPKFRDIPIQRAVAISCAAPTYFQAVDTEIDGGVWAADPSVEAYAEAKRLWPGEPVRVVTLGTGYYDWTLTLRTEGFVYWGQNIVETLMGLQTRRTEYVMDKISGEHYHLFNPVISRNNRDMDDADKPNMMALRSAAIAHARQYGPMYEEVAGRLTAEKVGV